MKKPLFYISSPYDTYSGYGARARDIIKSILKTDKYGRYYFIFKIKKIIFK